MRSNPKENSFEDYCPQCLFFEEESGVCKKIYANVREYPTKFIKKCNGNFYEYDTSKDITESRIANFSFKCPNCQTKYSAKPSQAGKKDICKNCGNQIIVPKFETENKKSVTNKESEDIKSDNIQAKEEPQFWDSNIALIIGILSFLGSLNSFVSGQGGSDPLAGLFLILGALVYKSIKKRKYGLSLETSFRKGLELGTLGLILILLFLQNNYLERLERDPLTNFVIPLAVFIACGIMYSKVADNTHHELHKGETSKICEVCGESISVKANYCAACGSATQLKCTKCQALLSQDAKFCSQCGAAV